MQVWINTLIKTQVTFCYIGMPLAQSGSWGFVLEEGIDSFGGKIVSGELEFHAYIPTAA